MSKLFNLKEWLTVPDAARHLSIVFGEEVTEADVLRLALDRRLRLSVNFVNGATGRCGRVVPIDEAEYKEVPALNGKGTLRLYEGPQLYFEGRAISVVKLEEEVRQLRGIYDLPMIGSEKLDVENEYQNQIGGPTVTLVGMDGAFVEGRNGLVAQIQEDYDDNPHQNGSTAQLERLKERIADNNIGEEKAEALLRKHSEDRKEFLKRRLTQVASERYYPRDGLPSDSVLVVRTDSLREFERAISATPASPDQPTSPNGRAHVSDRLAKLNQAAAKFWSNADRDDRGTHPDNAKVATWLVQQGFSQTLADKAATIIRPEWAPTGRKPEE